MQKKSFRKICALLLSVALMCGILPATVIADGDPDPNVTYVDVNYYRGGSTDTLPLTKTCEVINDDRAEVVLTDTGYTNGWYVINNTDYYTFDGRISVSGNVNLILANFAPYQPTGGISVNYGNSLTVYRGADGAVGLLGIYSLSNEYLGCAGIGGDSGYTNGNITICGGSSINACGNGGAGIGSGANATSSSIGTVRIDGGNVSGYSTSDTYAAGIGGGDGSVAAPVVINGGSVSGSAWRGQYAAGIGSGRNGVFNSVTIKGGVVIANGGFEAPGIGSGVIDSPVNNNAKISISYARVLSRAGQNSTEAKAFYSAKKGAGGDVYSGTLSVTSKEYGVIYADNNYGDDAHHPEFTKVTASEALNYKWVEVCACIHYDEDDNRICDECGLAICKTDVDAVHGSDNVAYLLKGEKLHKPEDPVADGYVFLGWKQYDLVNHVFLDEYDFDTPVNEDTFVVAVWEQVSKATMCSGNMVFGSGLELEFRMQFTDYILENHPNAKVVFTKKGQIVKTTKISKADAIDGDNYYFRVPVELTEYNEYVIVKVLDENDEAILLVHPDGTTAYQDNECLYSVAKYVRDVISATDTSDGMKNLAAYLWGYCEAVTRYFVHDDGTEYSRWPKISNFEYSEDKIAKYGVVKTKNQVEGCLGASLNVDFQYINTLRLTFKIDNTHPISDYSFTVDGQPAEAVNIGTGKYALYVNGIVAKDLGVAHTFTVIRNNTNESFSVTASSMSYALLASQNAASTRGKYLGKALYCYGELADAYFNHN